MNVIGLDIGGANLKAARFGGEALLRPFALWKRPDGLVDELRQLLSGWAAADRFAVTMTAELCDCFADRPAGVRHILGAMAAMAGQTPVHIWRTDGRFASLGESSADPIPAASANWLALATFAGRFAPNSSAVVLDIGSTTTDITPLLDGRPIPAGRTDRDRLETRELVYIGGRRTPICALLGPGEGMAEFFATTLDVGLIVGAIPENERDRDTADGRPATRVHASARLARMLGGDAEIIGNEAIDRFADRLAQIQRDAIVSAIETVAARLPQVPKTAVICGSGSFIAASALQEFARRRQTVIEMIDLQNRLGPKASTAACALAVATLNCEAGVP
jgi:(4-(4-[2-(gamma-L-glutamylamino)ethyl]phenoxymethyl)furan-2-yl)methanamine synthase